MEVNLTETQRVAVKKHCGCIWEKDCNGKLYARIYPYDSFVRTVCADVLAKMDKRSERLVMALTSKDTFFNMVTGNWNFKTSDSAYCRGFADEAKTAMVKALDDLLNGKVWETKAKSNPMDAKIGMIKVGKQVALVAVDSKLGAEPTMKRSWQDYEPAAAKAYEQWQSAMRDYREAVNASYETEEFVIVEKPKMDVPVLDDDSRAWLYIDGLCESNAQGRFTAGLKAKDAVMGGSMMLVQAMRQAEADVNQYVNEHIWD